MMRERTRGVPVWGLTWARQRARRAGATVDSPTGPGATYDGGCPELSSGGERREWRRRAESGGEGRSPLLCGSQIGFRVSARRARATVGSPTGPGATSDGGCRNRAMEAGGERRRGLRPSPAREPNRLPCSQCRAGARAGSPIGPGVAYGGGRQNRVAEAGEERRRGPRPSPVREPNQLPHQFGPDGMLAASLGLRFDRRPPSALGEHLVRVWPAGDGRPRHRLSEEPRKGKERKERERGRERGRPHRRPALDRSPMIGLPKNWPAAALDTSTALPCFG